MRGAQKWRRGCLGIGEHNETHTSKFGNWFVSLDGGNDECVGAGL